jgi:threonylcarbamoyladenosine tRNA methylthiotransferase MtaB
MPDVAIGVDVLVGFPGETQQAFENTCNLLEGLPIAYLHVFPFSKLKQTRAAALPGTVPPEELKKRCQHVRAIGEAKRRRFYQKAIGSTCEVLIEGKRDRVTGHLKGLSKNYIPVLIEGDDALMNHLVQTRITKVEGGKVFAECLPTP